MIRYISSLLQSAGSTRWAPRAFLALALLFTTAFSTPTVQAHEGDVDDVSAFYEPLSGQGDWYYTNEYGYVWSPWGVDPSWRPYTHGHWVMTDAYGWMWVSDEPWAWATYHYGRWLWLNGAWVWVPGTTWGPAWVAWSYTDSYVGWAPLPPGATVSTWSGTVNLNVNIAWHHWVYVPGPRLLEINLYPWYLAQPQVQVVYYRAVPATRYRVYGGTIYCLGVNTVYVSGWLGYSVPVVTVSWTNSPAAYYRGGTVYLYRTPPPPPPAWRHAPPPPQRAVPPALRTSVVTPPPPAGRPPRQPVSPPAPGYRSGTTRQAPPPAQRATGPTQTPRYTAPTAPTGPRTAPPAPGPRTTPPSTRTAPAPSGTTAPPAPHGRPAQAASLERPVMEAAPLAATPRVKAEAPRSVERAPSASAARPVERAPSAGAAPRTASREASRAPAAERPSPTRPVPAQRR